MFKGWEPVVDICVSDMGGDDGLVSLCLDEADEIHEWESNPLFAPDPKICEEKGCWLGTRILL